MSNVTGVVNEVLSFKTAGGATMYSIIVEGNRYGTGSNSPNCKAGDTVEFGVVQKGQYLNVAPRSLRVVSAGTAADVAKATVSAGNSNDARQEVISRQAAANTAIAFVELVRAADAIPGVTAKMDPSKKYDIVEALVERKLADFYKSSTGKTLPGSKREVRRDVADEPDAEEEAPQSEWS